MGKPKFNPAKAGANAPGQSDYESKTYFGTRFSAWGRFSAPTWGELATAAVLEILGTALLAFFVLYKRYSVNDTDASINGLHVALVYGVANLVIKTAFHTKVLPRKLNLATVVLDWLAVADIGPLSLLFYIVCDTAGAALGGAFLIALVQTNLGPIPAGPPAGLTSPINMLVPAPFAAVVNYVTIVCLEIFMTGIIQLVGLLVRYYRPNQEDEETENALTSLPSRYTTFLSHLAETAAIVLIVMTFFPIQSYQYNNNLELAAIVAGSNNPNAQLRPENAGLFNQDATAGIFTATAFDGHSPAWSTYIFASMFGGAAIAYVMFTLITVFDVWVRPSGTSNVPSFDPRNMSKSQIKSSLVPTVDQSPLLAFYKSDQQQQKNE